MEYKDYNRTLAQRFVNDYRLPIPIINREIFFHHVLNYQDDLQSWTLWCDTIDIINDQYRGDVQDFLDDFYTVRDKVITSIKGTDAYKHFNEMSMDQFSVDMSKYKYESKGCYNEMNVGRKLISIDLSSANFQALRYVDSGIVFNYTTYKDLIASFTYNPYIINSKYFRQVVFGQLNPGRHTTIEKYLICKVLDHIIEAGKVSNIPVKIVSINSDEIILEDNDTIIPELFVPMILNKYGIQIHVERFELEGYNLYTNNDDHHRCTFYAKNGNLMCVPGPYYAIVHKLYNGYEPSKMDYHFNYEGIDCIFNDTFRIEKI